MILTACERVIIDRQSSLPSLINIFQRMNVQTGDTPPPSNAVSPQRWAVFALWVHTPDEREIEYVQRTEIFDAAGTKFADSTTLFKITDADDLQSKNHLDVLGMPIGPEGFVKVRVWLEGIANTTGEYQFALKHIKREQRNEQQS